MSPKIVFGERKKYFHLEITKINFHNRNLVTKDFNFLLHVNIPNGIRWHHGQMLGVA
jgi:hypothetical protein